MANTAFKDTSSFDAEDRAGGDAVPAEAAPAAGYAGDIDSRSALGVLRSNQRAVLIDVRTAPEWDYVGRPDLSGLSGRAGERAPVFVSWKHWPDGARTPERSPGSGLVPNQRFVQDVREAGITKDQPVLLLCRSGQRSRDAAIALTAAGFTQCFNIADGFEGKKDPSGHRNTVEGWRQAGLPWIQG